MKNLRVKLATMLLHNIEITFDDLSQLARQDFKELLEANQQTMLRNGLTEVFKKLPTENLQSLVLLSERLSDDQKLAIAGIFSNQASRVDNSRHYLM